MPAVGPAVVTYAMLLTQNSSTAPTNETTAVLVLTEPLLPPLSDVVGDFAAGAGYALAVSAASRPVAGPMTFDPGG